MNPTPETVHGTGAAGGQAVFDTTGVPWLDGTAHPVEELTHLTALLLLGLAAVVVGGRSRWGLPLLYACLLAFGIVLGTQGAIAPMLNTILLTAVLCLALLILGRVQLLFATVATITGAFALFHGVADGFYMRATNLGIQYAVGYAAANLAVVLCGVFVGEWIHWRTADWSRHWSEHLHHAIEHIHGLHLRGH